MDSDYRDVGYAQSPYGTLGQLFCALFEIICTVADLYHQWNMYDDVIIVCTFIRQVADLECRHIFTLISLAMRAFLKLAKSE